MAEGTNRDHDPEGAGEGQGIFDVFEPPPDPHPNSFGKVPVVREEEPDPEVAKSFVEQKAAADAQAAGLAHWTAPASGVVPAVLASEFDAEQNIKGPSWHGEDPSWAATDLSEVFGDDPGIGRPRRQRPDPAAQELAANSGITRLPREAVDPRATNPVHHGDADPRPRPTGRSIPNPSRPSSPGAAGPDSTVIGAMPSAPAPAPMPLPLRPQPPAGGRPLSSPPDPVNVEAPRGRGAPTVTYSDDGQSDYGDYEEYDDYDYDDDGMGSGPGRDLPKAIGTGVGLLVVLVLAAMVGPEAMLALIVALAVMAVIELFGVMRLAGLRPASLFGIGAVAAFPVAAAFRGDAAFPLLCALLVIFGAIWYLAGADRERPVLNLALTLFGVLWVGGLASFGALMLRMEFGIEVLVSTILITVASDTVAYVGGKSFGRHPFHPASPNKTWEGTLFGFAGAVFAGFGIGILDVLDVFSDNLVGAIALGAVVGVMAPIGDLAESLVKRDLGVKDMGDLIPGHGGVLDRLDGLLFALPGAYYLCLLLGLFPIA